MLKVYVNRYNLLWVREEYFGLSKHMVGKLAHMSPDTVARAEHCGNVHKLTLYKLFYFYRRIYRKLKKLNPNYKANVELIWP